MVKRRIKLGYRIKNPRLLSTILWTDFILGATTGLTGLIFFERLSSMLGLSEKVLIWISSITLFYSFFAFMLATKKPTSILLLWILIFANLLWTMISFGIISIHFSGASILGQAYLILQVLVVGGLAWLERNQLEKL